jgi:chromate transport protein ChrA
MRPTDFKTVQRRLRVLLTLFIVLLLLAALTAWFLIPALSIFQRLVGEGTFIGSSFPSVAHWVTLIQKALVETKEKYPFMFYGTDWVGFAHLVMIIACIGPLRNPIKNIWVLQFSMIGCILMIPMTLITGIARGLPWFWHLFDCVIAATGAILFLMCWRYARQMETLSVSHGLKSGSLKD